MLLTVTTTHEPATDLGFLLHKHPDRVQQFRQAFGTATVCYPQASAERCTAALVIEVDPVRLARTVGRGSPDFSLSQYVNDRPYAASSLLAVALGDVFSTARAGRCAARPELADTAIPLEIDIPVVPCPGGPAFAERIFGPLGWRVDARPIPLDPDLAQWGDSRYVRLSLCGTLRLADALNQLHVLLPTLDESKHYWQGSDEVDKLLRSGAGWLARHPEREVIARRYLGRHGSLTHAALARLAELGDDVPESLDPPADEDAEDGAAPPDVSASGRTELAQPRVALPPNTQPLNLQRHDAVLGVIADSGARSVIDLGCGPGALIARLATQGQLRRIAGTDVSTRSLHIAARRLHLDSMSERQSGRIALFQAALTYEDPRFAGYDVAGLMGVNGHLDPSRLDALGRVVFGGAAPGMVIVTTPNREFNVRYAGLTGPRHPDHRFEWDRTEFAEWAARVAAAYGYHVTHQGVGPSDEALGAPTQMAVFTHE